MYIKESTLRIQASGDANKVEEIINELRPQLPIQNPMPFFVHNNPLQYWEKFSFEEGVKQAVLTYENVQEDKLRIIWRELEDLVIPLALSYFDQGLNRWSLPLSKNGLWNWYCDFIETSWGWRSRALPQLKKQMDSFRSCDPVEVITQELRKRYPKQELWHSYLQTLVFHFKGWSGMIQVLERNPSLFPLQKYKVSLLEWIAILVTAEKALSVEYKLSHWTPWKAQFAEPRRRSISNQLNDIKQKELKYYRETIRTLKEHIVRQQSDKSGDPAVPQRSPNVQVFFCLDDREESLRRALEETNNQYETYGTLGFFGVDFSLKRPGHVIFQPQCPPVIHPRKRAEEHVAFEKPTLLQRLREALPYLNESRFTFIEPLFAVALWPIYALALMIRSVSPGLYHHLRDWLRLDQYLEGHNSIHFIDEYSTEEKTNIVADLLGGAGLTQIDSQLVILLGHAATTTNNPFQKSYGCGACSGQSGFSNAKVFAEFANDPKVRAALQEKNIWISESVFFLAACHDTCADEIHYAPSAQLSEPHRELLLSFQKDMEVALRKNQEERWRQFNLPKGLSAIERSADWSQPRPEFGHSGVALSVFGPRRLTKGLDLGRRAFLVSYDPNLDLDGSHLAYVILNALPVCANINLDYFTSRAFPDALGAGSKLPLNIAAGIGLMPGSKGDLRIGLATQMVDQHEPLRLLAFIYCESDHLTRILNQSPRLQNLVKNNWIHLIRIDPKTLAFEVLTEELSNGFGN